MIDKLSNDAIIEIERSIWSDKEFIANNQYYFKFEHDKYSDEAYILNGYYINFNLVNGIWWIGFIKLREGGTLGSIVRFFKEQLQEKKVIGMWRDEKNIILEKLYGRIKEQLNHQEILKDDLQILIIRS